MGIRFGRLFIAFCFDLNGEQRPGQLSKPILFGRVLCCFTGRADTHLACQPFNLIAGRVQQAGKIVDFNPEFLFLGCRFVIT